MCTQHAPIAKIAQRGLNISTEDLDPFKKARYNVKQVLLALKSFGNQARRADDIE